MNGLSPEMHETFLKLRMAARVLRSASSLVKRAALERIATRIERDAEAILQANLIDLQELDADTSAAFRDRLTLNPARLKQMIVSLRQVAALADPVGEVVDSLELQNGLQARRVRAPFGVILMIFESRPNVILEAFSLAFQSGNVIALRGGSDSKHTAKVLYQLLREELQAASTPSENLADTFYGFDNYDRGVVSALLRRSDLIDIVVPRGGDKLIDFVTQTATMPIIKNDRGLCHAYVDAAADLAMATKIVFNAKTQRPGVCNSLETLLVHRSVAARFLPMIFAQGQAVGLEWRCDAEALAILTAAAGAAAAGAVSATADGAKSGAGALKLAAPSDYDTEHLAQILNCRVVGDFAEALKHIELHGSRHSETIITSDEQQARRFQSEVDAAVVYWNASTRFTDGFELGLGGELGISTQKLHVRGPVGLRELTTPRWIIDGTGQTRE